MPPTTSISTSTPKSPLIAFYSPPGTTPCGGWTLTIILSFDFAHLEGVHDYIQILFPLPEASGISWSAPVITREVFSAFRSRVELRDNLRLALKKMCWFYGFDFSTSPSSTSSTAQTTPTSTITITPSPTLFSTHSPNWDTPFNHNHLRITRIIRSLRVLGLESEAEAFYTALNTHSKYANRRSREYWRRAAKRTLNLRPDVEGVDDGDLEVGKGFLREWEEERWKERENEEESKKGGEKEEEELEKQAEKKGEKETEKDVAVPTEAAESENPEKEEEEWEGIEDNDDDDDAQAEETKSPKRQPVD